MANTKRYGTPNDGALRSDMGPGVSPQDPTALTTQQVLREGFWSRELYEAQIASIVQRLEASDKAVKLLQEFADRTPTTMDVQNKVEQLREVVMEKFAGIKDTFAQAGTALTAALQAQEKQAIATNDSNKAASDKMEAGFTKQIDMFSTTNKTELKGIRDIISDIKERITIIESRTSIIDPTNAITLAKLDEKVSRLTSSGDVVSGAAAAKDAAAAANRAFLGSIISIASVIILSIPVIVLVAKAFMK
jgi:chromosome condensin MukBEF ATPase and DNA-binding subunit MukB